MTDKRKRSGASRRGSKAVKKHRPIEAARNGDCVRHKSEPVMSGGLVPGSSIFVDKGPPFFKDNGPLPVMTTDNRPNRSPTSDSSFSVLGGDGVYSVLGSEVTDSQDDVSSSSSKCDKSVLERDDITTRVFTNEQKTTVPMQTARRRLERAYLSEEDDLKAVEQSFNVPFLTVRNLTMYSPASWPIEIDLVGSAHGLGIGSMRFRETQPLERRCMDMGSRTVIQSRDIGQVIILPNHNKEYPYLSQRDWEVVVIPRNCMGAGALELNRPRVISFTLPDRVVDHDITDYTFHEQAALGVVAHSHTYLSMFKTVLSQERIETTDLTASAPLYNIIPRMDESSCKATMLPLRASQVSEVIEGMLYLLPTGGIFFSSCTPSLAKIFMPPSAISGGIYSALFSPPNYHSIGGNSNSDWRAEEDGTFELTVELADPNVGRSGTDDGGWGQTVMTLQFGDMHVGMFHHVREWVARHEVKLGESVQFVGMRGEKEVAGDGRREGLVDVV